MVEQWPFKPLVAGSSPSTLTSLPVNAPEKGHFGLSGDMHLLGPYGILSCTSRNWDQ